MPCDHGAVYFHPDLELYTATCIQPHVSPVVEGRDYSLSIRERAASRGMRFGAWIVYLYDHHLARSHPKCAKVDVVDVFGNLYESMLCPANPDVRGYALALTQDVLSQFDPDSVVLESLCYLHFEYGFLNPKLLVTITPRDRFLLGLCFCPHCLEAAEAAGVDGAGFKQRVADFLGESLPREPRAMEKLPVDAAYLERAFDGELERYLDVRVGVAASLHDEVVKMIRSHGDGRIAIYSGLPREHVLSVIDEVFASIPEGTADLAAFRRAEGIGLPPEVRFRPTLQPENLNGPDGTRNLIESLGQGSNAELTLYHFGLARLEHLQWIGAAIGGQ